MKVENTQGQWPTVAENFVRLINHPLRPIAEDIDFLHQKIEHWQQTHTHAPRVLILGVTPEYFYAQWPKGTHIFALDQTREMIEFVWPGPREQAIQGSWLETEFPQHHFDCVLCDGSINMLKYPEHQTRLAERLAYLIAPGGFFLSRLFTASTKKPSTSEVLQQLLDGKFPSLNHLKISLWLSLQTHSHEGTLLADVWNAVHTLEPNQQKLAQQLGWKLEELQMINAYRDNSARYYFPTIEQVIELFHSQKRAAFQLQQVHIPRYFMGEQFPTVIFNRL